VREHIAPYAGREATLALGGTSLRPSWHCEHAGYCSAFGLLFFDDGVPPLWFHVRKGDTGSLDQAEDVELTLITSREAGSARNVFVAADGDRLMGKRHQRMFGLFAGLLESMSLDEIVAHLESSKTDVFQTLVDAECCP
jgi:hypothetical protein